MKKDGKDHKTKWIGQGKKGGTEYKEKKLGFKRLKDHIDPDSAVETLNKQITLRILQSQSDNRSGNAANRDRKNLAAVWQWGIKYLEGFPQDPNPFIAIERFPEERFNRYVPPESDFLYWWENRTHKESQHDFTVTGEYRF